MSNSTISENLLCVRRQIARAAEAAGRNADEINLVAVSKTVDPEHVRAAMDCGHNAFGENRPQELERKVSALKGQGEWHFIGHLQSNKVRNVVRTAAWIHSVDSAKLVSRIERIAGDENRHLRILLQVNVSGENSKFGLSPEDVAPLIEKALGCRNLDCRGLMTMAPYGAPDTELHRLFAATRELRDKLADRFNTPLPDLSMGMSGDFPQAIAEGATIVRIGSAIFGARSY